MNDLIEALQIFAKYHNPRNPTHCEHDTLYVMEVGFDEVSDADKKRLDELGFIWDEDEDVWISFRFGSA